MKDSKKLPTLVILDPKGNVFEKYVVPINDEKFEGRPELTKETVLYMLEMYEKGTLNRFYSSEKESDSASHSFY